MLTSYSTYFEQAVRGYRSHQCYIPELALSLYGLSETQRANGDEIRAKNTIEEANRLYRKQNPSYDVIGNITAGRFESQIALPAR